MFDILLTATVMLGLYYMLYRSILHNRHVVIKVRFLLYHILYYVLYYILCLNAHNWLYYDKCTQTWMQTHTHTHLPSHTCKVLSLSHTHTSTLASKQAHR